MCFFAAAYSRSGSARDLLLLGRTGYVRLFVSRVVFIEVERNLAAKARQALPALRTFTPDVHFVTDPAPELIDEVAKIVEIKDAPIVAGAVAASADYLATYDRKHLLAPAALFQPRFNVVVSTPDRILVEILQNWSP